MKRIFAIAVAVSILGLFSTANGQGQAKTPEAKTPAKDQVKLPESKTTAVFTIEFSGGFRLPNDKDRKPFLQVFADGRVVTPPRFPATEANEFQLKPEQLQTFLRQVVNENKFYELDTDKIKEEVAAAGPVAFVADAPTLEISMELPRGAHAVSAYTPKSTSKQLPKVDGIKRIANIEELGRQLSLVAIAGGYETIERALLKVNEQLKEKELELMTINELYTCKRKDGVLTINFNRKYYQKDGRWRDWINAKVTVNGDEEGVEIKTNIGQSKKKVKPQKKAAKSSKQ